jgi:transposase
MRFESLTLLTTTFVADLRHDEINAPCVFDGPMNGASFLTYVEHFLAPALRQGDIVVMDNRKARSSCSTSLSC